MVRLYTERTDRGLPRDLRQAPRRSRFPSTIRKQWARRISGQGPSGLGDSACYRGLNMMMPGVFRMPREVLGGAERCWAVVRVLGAGLGDR